MSDPNTDPTDNPFLAGDRTTAEEQIVRMTTYIAKSDEFVDVMKKRRQEYLSAYRTHYGETMSDGTKIAGAKGGALRLLRTGVQRTGA